MCELSNMGQNLKKNKEEDKVLDHLLDNELSLLDCSIELKLFHMDVTTKEDKVKDFLV